MPLTPDEERRIEELMNQARREGVRSGRRSTLMDIIASRARQMLEADFSAAARLIEAIGLSNVSGRLAREASENWIPRWLRPMMPVFENVMYSETKDKAEYIGNAFDVKNPRMREYLENFVLELAGQVTETTRRRVEEIVQDSIETGRSVDETAALIRQTGEEVSGSRAQLIARTELNRSSNAAAYLQAVESGVISHKIWHTAGDSRVRDEHRHMEGETVPIAAVFSNGLLFPSEPNCRCWIEYVVDFEALEAAQENVSEDLIDELVEDDERVATEDEIAELRERVGNAPFNPRDTDVEDDLIGSEFRGRTLTDREPSVIAHNAKRHEEGQWRDTSEDQYHRDLQTSASDPSARIAVEEKSVDTLLYVLGPNSVPESRRGEVVEDEIVVIYSATSGRILSGYQVTDYTLPKGARWVDEPRQ